MKQTGKIFMIELICMATAIFFEARGEHYDGKVAVGQVIMNRVNSEEYSQTICEVVEEPYQFSFMNDGKSDNPHDYIKNEIDQQAWSDSVVAATEVMYDNPEIEIGSLFYHTDDVDPEWNDNMKIDGKIGSHIFYSERKS